MLLLGSLGGACRQRSDFQSITIRRRGCGGLRCRRVGEAENRRRGGAGTARREICEQQSSFPADRVIGSRQRNAALPVPTLRLIYLYMSRDGSPPPEARRGLPSIPPESSLQADMGLPPERCPPHVSPPASMPLVPLAGAHLACRHGPATGALPSGSSRAAEGLVGG